MIQEFETTGQLGLLLGREQKHITSSSIENVATAVVEACNQFPGGRVNVPFVSRAAKNPHAVQEKPMHPKTVTVWRVFTATFLIGPYCFEEIKLNGTQNCVCSVTGKGYHDMLRAFVILELQQRGCFQDTTFIQDDISGHIDHRGKDLLKQHFTDARMVWIRDTYNLKDNIYCQRPSTLPDLKESIRHHVLDIPADLLWSAIENMILCLQHIVEYEGDEAHFWLNGYVNKQNCRIWSEDNPQVYVETPLHPEKLTVLCALWAGGILLQKR
ncbi:uncharacterized protein TNCV_2065261 [Trichonephila clavipes]|nr:uncharacterized protein TNCV_2065261 [Trichonephila clavipes]